MLTYEKKKAKEAMSMNKNDLQNFARLALLADESKIEIEQLKKKISDLELEKKNAVRQGRHHDSIERLIMAIQRQLDLEEEMLLKRQEIINSVQAELVEKAHLLTPLEMFVIKKRYVEGLRWKELYAETDKKPEYAIFRLEHSSYMRAHRHAMEKLCGEEGEAQHR